ncbi:Putative Holin-like phage protein (fragment) [Cupriavidus necator]|uniref:Putative Holin-like phage protein n=1 Tax=Cupriavidus necator TaxID=106590 RepID=A0A1K0J8U6_CUPNE
MIEADMANEAVKLVPAAPVTVMTFMGYSVQDWASWLTAFYVLLLIGNFIWNKVLRPWMRARRKEGGPDA